MSQPRQLSTGSCIWLSETSAEKINANSSVFTLQVLSIERATPSVPSTVERYRIILSDGAHFIQAMLMTDLTESVTRGDIPQSAIVIISQLQCHIVSGTRLIIIHDLRVLSKDERIIGSPRPAPMAETSIAQTSKRDNVEMDVEPQASNSMGAKPSSGLTQPVPVQKPVKQTIAIEGISTYNFNSDLAIKARVTHKSKIQPFSNGTGKRFSVTFMDQTGEISATGFTNVVDELYDQFEEGKVYYVSKMRVKLANEKFKKGPHSCELYFETNTEVEECLDGTDIPTSNHQFIPLSSLHKIEKDSMIDVIGVVVEAGPLAETVSKKDNRPIKRCDLTIVDNSLSSVRLTIWGNQAETFRVDNSPVIALKAVKVRDFGGRTLSMVSATTLSVSPNIPEAHFLRGWYDTIGIQKSFQSCSMSGQSEMRSIKDIVESVSQLGPDDKMEFSTCATVMRIHDEKLTYPACPMQGCSKKVAQIMGSDGWRCDKCQKTFPRPQHRYRITMAVSDWSGQTWFTGFDPIGVAVLGKTAEELEELRERNEKEYKAVVGEASRKTYNFRCVAKQDTHNGQKSVKYDIIRISPLDGHQEAGRLRDLLMRLDMNS